MYYISSGFGNGMYTLREHNYIPTNYGFNEKDSYIRNLSRDFDKAITKAKEYVGDSDKLEVGNKFDLEKWGEAEKPYRWEAPELTPEEIAKREAEAKAKAEKKAIEDAEYAEIKRQEQEVYDKADPVPVTDDRIKFTGVIQKTYFTNNQWGGSTRMFFIDDRGFRLNGSAIKETYIDEDGDEDRRFVDDAVRVSFVAKVTPSDDDPKFGFVKRPNNVEVL
tara:strand:- start:98 stop:757 length:660 start_codon:yes stop_codon:yes gene_type:complete